MIDANDVPHNTESLNQQLEHAAEELITADSDDPPLSEEAIRSMVNDAHAQRLGSSS
jgi:hypothetical protein